MDLENKLRNIPRHRSSNLFNYVFYGFLSLCSAFGCDKNGHSPISDPPTPGNRNPVITSSLKTNADEGDNYFDRVTASDPDNDNLAFNLTQKPNGMTINLNDGSISWNDAKEGIHNVSVEVIDGKGGKATQNATLTVVNKFDDISGKVLDILNGSNITTATDIILGHRDNGNFIADYTATCDSQGNYFFTRIPTGTKLVKAGNNLNYFDILVGGLTTNRNETNVDIGLVPRTLNIDFFNEVARNPVAGGQTQRWLTIPQIYIDISPARFSNISPTQQEIDLVESIFRNDVPRFNNGFTDGNIQIIKGTNPPVARGYILFSWDDTNLGGSHSESLNGNEIVFADTRVRTGLTGSQKLWIYRQECTQVWGPRNDDDDPPFVSSIFRDPQEPGTDNYTSADLDLGKILYSKFIAPGNKSVNGIDFVNPDNYTGWR